MTENTNPFHHRSERSEKVHRHMTYAHWAILKACDQIAKALHEFNAQEENQDTRKLAEEWGLKLKGIREMLESAMKSNSSIQNDLMRVTGCDGSCRR